MNIAETLSAAFENINWLSVVLATLSSFVFGSIWYHEKIMGKRWMIAVPLKKKQIENADMIRIFTLNALAAFVSAAALAVFVNIFSVSSMFEGALLGVVIGVFFVASSIASNYLFAQRKLELLLIDASYATLSITVMGAVLGAFS